MIAQSNTQNNEDWTALMIAFHKGHCFNSCWNACMGNWRVYKSKCYDEKHTLSGQTASVKNGYPEFAQVMMLIAYKHWV